MAARGWTEIEREIAGEKLATMRRIAEVLESSIREAERIRVGLVDLSAVNLASIAAAHGAARDRAVRYRWYLEVQREALGLFEHGILDEIYPLPPPLERL
jgi:hypothetical protein